MEVRIEGRIRKRKTEDSFVLQDSIFLLVNVSDFHLFT